MSKPITPKEAYDKKIGNIPDPIIKCFNEMIVENVQSVIRQRDVLERIAKDTIFKHGWLDIEPLYEMAGWEVKYDKPAYCETYEATFTFTVRTTT